MGPILLATLLPRNSLSQVSLGDVEPGYYESPDIENWRLHYGEPLVASITWNLLFLQLRRTYYLSWLLPLYVGSWFASVIKLWLPLLWNLCFNDRLCYMRLRLPIFCGILAALAMGLSLYLVSETFVASVGSLRYVGPLLPQLVASAMGPWLLPLHGVYSFFYVASATFISSKQVQP